MGSSPIICILEDPVEDGIASSMVEYYTSDIAILVRFQCNAINVDDHRGTQVLRTTPVSGDQLNST